MTRLFSFIICFLLLGTLPAQEREARFLRELRRLQLFDAAERYCQQQLARPELASNLETEFMVDYIRTVAMHALSSSAAEREPLWKQSRQLVKDFATKQPSHPRLLLIKVQDALTVQAQGDQQRREAESLTDPTERLTVASSNLRTAENMLDEIGRQIAQEITRRRTQPPRANELTVEELTRLKLQVDLQQARTKWSRAFCYAAESRDRKALLPAALESIEQGVKRINPNDELAGNFRVLQMACLRELKRYDEALRVWELIDRDDLPANLRREALAEVIRIRALAGEPREALQLLDEAKYLSLLQTREPELDLAKLEVVMRLTQQAATQNKLPELAQWQKTAAQLATQIERTHGGYWGNRADQLLASLAGASSEAAQASVDLLARQGDANYVKRKFEEAQLLYEQAAQAAHQAGQSDREFELRYKAALVAQERKQYALAAAGLERLAIDFKAHPQAAAAHLIACWNKAQQVRTNAEIGPAYAAMLEEHLARWPTASSADQANVWLGNWRQSQEAWSAAFTAYSAVRQDSPHFPAAMPGAAVCARRELAHLESLDKATEPIARQYVEYFHLTLPAAATTQPMNESQRLASLAAAEILVEYIPGGCSAAELILATALKNSPEENNAWRISAQTLFVAALAGQKGKSNDALQQLQQKAITPAQLLGLWERLSSIATHSSKEQRAALATVQLAVYERLEANLGQLSAAQKIELRRLHAAVLVQSGNRPAALEAYAKLTQEEPQNGNVQEAYAELLSQGTDADSLTAALAKWRQIAVKSKPREERWYKAKYAVASLQLRTGKKQEAAVLIRFLLETPPGIGDVGWKQRFETLLDSCER